MSNRVILIVALLLCLATAGSWIVQAAEAQNPAFTLAFVDLKRISTEYEGTKQSQAELSAYQETLRKQLTDLEDVRFLTADERKEMDGLRAAASPTDDQKKRIQALLDANKTRLDRFRTLQQNATKTDAEKTELDGLSKSSAATDTELDQLSDKLDQQLQQKGTELSDKLTQTVTTAIAAVAKDKNITVVEDKQAILYGGTDITDDVLKQLVKK